MEVDSLFDRTVSGLSTVFHDRATRGDTDEYRGYDAVHLAHCLSRQIWYPQKQTITGSKGELPTIFRTAQVAHAYDIIDVEVGALFDLWKLYFGLEIDQDINVHHINIVKGLLRNTDTRNFAFELLPSIYAKHSPDIDRETMIDLWKLFLCLEIEKDIDVAHLRAIRELMKTDEMRVFVEELLKLPIAIENPDDDTVDEFIDLVIDVLSTGEDPINKYIGWHIPPMVLSLAELSRLPDGVSDWVDFEITEDIYTFPEEPISAATMMKTFNSKFASSLDNPDLSCCSLNGLSYHDDTLGTDSNITATLFTHMNTLRLENCPIRVYDPRSCEMVQKHFIDTDVIAISGYVVYDLELGESIIIGRKRSISSSFDVILLVTSEDFYFFLGTITDCEMRYTNENDSISQPKLAADTEGGIVTE